MTSSQPLRVMPEDITPDDTVASAARVFVFPARVYYEDTDAQGVVYHANFLKFAERARTEFMRACGYDHGDLLKDHGIMLAVKRINLEFFAPARMDDLLEIHTTLANCGPVTLDLCQNIRNGDKMVARVDVRVFALSPDGKPQRLPAPLRECLQAGPRVK
jgi:acyl-CoA thioester hydrolase